MGLAVASILVILTQMTQVVVSTDPAASVRLDKWLWAARFYKTRTLATAACTAGHIKINGDSAKSSKSLKIGMTVEAVLTRGKVIVEVLALLDKRMSAPIAQSLYLDKTPAPPPVEIALQVPVRERGAGRPSKQDRRQLRKLRGR